MFIRYRFRKLLLLFIISLIICGCNSEGINYEEFISCDREKSLLEDGAILIDVRTLQEYNEGYLDNAINIPYDTIKDAITEYVDSLDEMIIVYCKSGKRASFAKETLEGLGYKNVYNLGAISKCYKK